MIPQELAVQRIGRQAIRSGKPLPDSAQKRHLAGLSACPSAPQIRPAGLLSTSAALVNAFLPRLLIASARREG